MKDSVPASLELSKVLTFLASFAVSEAGQQAALALRPYTSIDAVAKQAALFEQGRIWAAHEGVTLSSFPTLEGLLQYVAAPSACLDLDGLWALRQVLVQAKKIIDSFVDGHENTRWPLWVERCHQLIVPAKSMSALARCLSDDGRLRDEASPELAVVRGELRRLHQQCIRKVKDYAAEYNILHYLQDDFMTLSSDRYVLPLKANFKGRLQGVIHDYSQTGETCYFEPLFLVEINNRLQGLKREEREEERKVFLFLSSLVRDEIVGIKSAYALLVELDMFFASSSLAACYDGRMVLMQQEAGILLREARHPLLALSSSKDAVAAYNRFVRRQAVLVGGETALNEVEELSVRGQQHVVPSTLELHTNQRALVISGGNAGGKTVCLKTLGLTALMSMCALPVPVLAGSYLPNWHNIHAFIGDEQSLEDHVSTFTAQITHLARIWDNLGNASLVILDEFGAGTDPSQGAALAQAVVDGIVEKGAYVVVATHFPALKAYALSTEGVRSASVLFDPATKKPLFRLVYEQVGASQALDVAREHGLPDSVLKKAEQYLLVSGEDTTALVERLNELAVEHEKELAGLQKERAAFEEKRQKLQDKFAKERDALFEKVQKEAQQVLVDWKTGKASHKQALKELSKIRTELIKPANAQHVANRQDTARAEINISSLIIGQRITHVPWKKEGTLIEVDVRKKRVRIDLDGVTLWADASDITDISLQELGLASAKAVKSSVQQVSAVAANKKTSSMKSEGSLGSLPLHLDLRGMRADVALSELEKFLDAAILQGRMNVEVVHGRGTGALRREVHNFLRYFSPVAHFALAPEDRGGDGMTMVELK